MTGLCTTSAPGVEPADQQQSVAEQLHLVVQTIADLGADAEGRRRRPVPFPAEPSTLADQLTVVTNDLLAAERSEALLTELTERLDLLRAAL